MNEPLASLSCRCWLACMALAVAAVAGCSSAPLPLPLPPPGSPAADARSAQAGTDNAASTQGFARRVADVRATARAAGIGEATLSAVLDDVHDLRAAVERDRAQPEFTRTVWEYLDRALSPQRFAQGQDKLLQFRGEADAAAARHGVPPASVVAVAIRGLESNCGGHTGDIPTIDALATLGFDGRREDWARGQLLAALRIVQNGDIERERMIGSWAGALGQTQFLPSSFLAYAVDADGGGRPDLWGSVADVMLSTASFLARSGWQAGQSWGAEVQLPAGFDFGRADAEVRQSSARWIAEGVRATDGAALPEFTDGSILLPAGARGTTFLVGPNCRAILRCNNSVSYALAVGLLAQRLAGGPGVQAPSPRELQALTRSQLPGLQTALNQRGFDSGTPDGLLRPATRGAIRRHQRSVDLPDDGHPDLDLLQRSMER